MKISICFWNALKELQFSFKHGTFYERYLMVTFASLLLLVFAVSIMTDQQQRAHAQQAPDNYSAHLSAVLGIPRLWFVLLLFAQQAKLLTRLVCCSLTFKSGVFMPKNSVENFSMYPAAPTPTASENVFPTSNANLFFCYYSFLYYQTRHRPWCQCRRGPQGRLRLHRQTGSLGSCRESQKR